MTRSDNLAQFCAKLRRIAPTYKTWTAVCRKLYNTSKEAELSTFGGCSQNIFLSRHQKCRFGAALRQMAQCSVFFIPLASNVLSQWTQMSMTAGSTDVKCFLWIKTNKYDCYYSINCTRHTHLLNRVFTLRRINTKGKPVVPIATGNALL